MKAYRCDKCGEMFLLPGIAPDPPMTLSWNGTDYDYCIECSNKIIADIIHGRAGQDATKNQE